ncbi:MAG: hydroxymethylbilane synthase [Actinomycetota bacterium]|nr:hydroxymethylbilane synthase [Actinomycetota bacterium]
MSRLLRDAHPDLEVEVKVVKTTGDADSRPFAEIGGKGLFTTEVEAEVMTGGADVAVHSAKDLTADVAEGCVIVCVPTRGSVHDVVVGGHGSSGEERLAALPRGATVGTSSLRRRALLLDWRPDLEVVEFRGNVDTRLKKVSDGVVDAAILAAAGLERLGLDAGAAPLATSRWLPAPAQGTIAIEAQEDRNDLKELFAPLEDSVARAEFDCERAFSRAMEGGCSVPLGCLARASEGRVVADGFLGLPDGSHSMRDRISGGAHEAAALGAELAEAIISCGGREILEELEEFASPMVPEP